MNDPNYAAFANLSAIGYFAWAWVRIMKQPEGMRHYFVDEAGDPTLFNARGAVIVGREGVSTTFMLGVARLIDPDMARKKLDELRSSLLADQYFKGVPSMQPNAGKTACCFHAKDDLPEVRREVFKLLPTLGAEVQIVVRRKSVMVSEARTAHRLGRKLSPNDVYDDLVKRLFKNLLHQGETNEICFARRGKTDRQVALEHAIERAKANFRSTWKTDVDRPTQVRSSVPSQEAGLQIVDYFLWALQRFYERDEDRYFLGLANRFRLIMDQDDTRLAPYGRWYTQRDPLTKEKRMPPAS